MLNSGIVPNIFTQDELSVIRTDMTKTYKRFGQTNESPDAMNDWFFTRVKDNMHLSILMSPVGDTFRSYCRQYPALINNTTIDWFMAWPEEALIEVANKFLGPVELPNDKRQGLANLCGYTHATTQASSNRMYSELKRMFYVTPTNFIELLKGYTKILNDKRQKVGTQINKLRNGLNKLEEAREMVKVMTAESEITRIEVTKKTSECEGLLLEVEREQKDGNEKSIIIAAEKKKIEAETITANALAASAEAELAKAMPSLQAAQDAVNNLDKKYIAEIKAFNNPPKDVAIVMAAVMTFMRKPTDWKSVKVELTDPKFVDKIMDFDKENIQ
jgi:dynein heavy chain, axonemal